MPCAARLLVIAVLYVFAAMLWAAPALAQSPEPPVRIARPQLAIPARVEAPIALESVSIRAEVHGRFALTEVELAFRNPNCRILEGELQFPLPEGQSMTGFAMDVDGKLRDAAEPVQRFRVANGDWRALRVALEATAYDGATNLGAFVPDNEVGEVLLFSDGLTNYGEQPFPATRVPVYAVSAAVSADAARLRNAAPENLYRVYLDERPDYLNSTAFFLDAADIFFDKGETALALRVLSNLAEMDLGSRHILRVLGQRLLQAGEAKLAIPVFRKVAELSPEEPQSGRDLGLAYAADRRFQKAIDTLYEVVIRPWHGRFPEVELITLAELNAIVTTTGVPLDTGRIDPRLLKNLPLDLRVVLTWDADNTDIDLWVTDPNGEKAFYGNRFTYQGGHMSLDFTGGYGPEEFSLKRAKPGKYRVEAQYFGDRRQTLAGPVTLQVKLTTKFGLPEQREQLVTLRLAVGF